MTPSFFENLRQVGSARAGVLHTPHGNVPTPALCVVNPWGLDPAEIHAAGASMVAVSNFDLQLGSGGALATREGGIHRFLRWDGPVIIDAGSDKIFANPANNGGHGRLEHLDSDGVTFASPIDGSRRRMTPESVLSEMAALSPDLMVPLFPSRSPGRKRPGLDLGALTAGWVERSIAVSSGPGSILLGVSTESPDGFGSPGVDVLSAFHPAGYAFIGIDSATLNQVVGAFPAEGVRFLSRATTPESIEHACAVGIDLVGWDARAGAAEGVAYTPLGAVRLREDTHRTSLIPLDESCSCSACGFTRAYLHHLFEVSELLGPRLVALHNLTHMCRLVAQGRAALLG